MGQRLLAVEPLARSVDAELRQAIGLSETAGGPEGLASRKAGALAVLGVTRVLRRLGLTFARVEAPRWAQPAVDWFADGADPGSLAAALEACSDGADSVDGEATGARAGRITVDPSFDLADVVATAWRAGVAVKWAEYHGEEPLGRVPLPAYPFTRSRLWLDRPVEPPRAEPESAGGESARASTVAGATTAAVRIEKVWRDVLGVRHPIAHDARFVDDLGGDSLYAVEIGARLNEEFGLDLPTDLPFVAPTITTAARYVAEALLKETTS
jgi:acyl carrier protein